MKLIQTYKTESQYDVQVFTHKKKLAVVYGHEKHLDLTYHEAAKHLGYCLLHALQCTGELDKLSESRGLLAEGE